MTSSALRPTCWVAVGAMFSWITTWMEFTRRDGKPRSPKQRERSVIPFIQFQYLTTGKGSIPVEFARHNAMGEGYHAVLPPNQTPVPAIRKLGRTLQDNRHRGIFASTCRGRFGTVPTSEVISSWFYKPRETRFEHYLWNHKNHWWLRWRKSGANPARGRPIPERYPAPSRLEIVSAFSR